MISDKIKIKGARTHNLKNVDLDIPRDKLVVLTGLSGSGKSTLAFDTIYAEGYRRFVESLSSYARQFLGQLDKPDIDSIEGLSPAIAIDQKTTSRNPRSTVGTVTEIYDYLRLLYARLGIPHCPICGKEIRQQTIVQIVDPILELPEDTRFQVLAPVVRGKKGIHEKVFDDAQKNGYVRIKVDGYMYELPEKPELDKNKRHNIEIVVDRLKIKEGITERLTDSVETALKLADGLVVIDCIDFEEKDRLMTFSRNFACDEHGVSIGELNPRDFSFNNPFGACHECAGLGFKKEVAVSKIIPDLSKSLADGAIIVNGFKSIEASGWSGRMYNDLGSHYGFDIHTPLSQYSDEAMHALLYGTDIPLNVKYEHRTYSVKFEGVTKIIEKRAAEADSEYYDEFFEEQTCPSCRGDRLKKEALFVTVGGKNISEFCKMSIKDSLSFVEGLSFSESEMTVAREILKQIKQKLNFLISVGLDYLSLERRSGTLSGGESQRIRLATQISSSLMGVLYILDEQSIGLHQRDNSKLINTLKELRDIGNTVIVVEHDTETIESADFVVDIGPGAGVNGGEIVFAGTPEKMKKCAKSLTGRYLSGKESIAVPAVRREGNGNFLTVFGARENNLKNVTVSLPLGTFTCVTGVSGSGKSSLVNEILYKSLASTLNRANTFPGKHDRIEGYDMLDKIIAIDQSPIGRTPRSNPATYTGVFTDIRTLFAASPDAKARGYGQNRFSFNLKGGRCEACEGDGTVKIEMHFLPDVYVTCDVCKGTRYNRETLEVKYKGKNIFEVLDMTVAEAAEFFKNIPSISRKLNTLCDVGLGYIKLGQSSTTLSGGEAQRIKLASELSKRSTGKTIYILDEPTTGLHSADVRKLIEVLQRLVDGGNTVVVIEHNLDMIKVADYIIDMGPEGGDRGGTVLVCGTPEEVAMCENSYTGQYLKKLLNVSNKDKTDD